MKMSYTCLLASTTSWGGISSVPISRTNVLSLSWTWNQRKGRNLHKLMDNHTIIIIIYIAWLFQLKTLKLKFIYW